MSLLDQITGRTPITEDLPMQAARTRPASMTRREEPKDKEEKKLRDRARHSSIVATIIGMTEGDDEGIIPHDAKPIDPYSSQQIPGLSTELPDLGAESPAEPSTSNLHGEELIPPTAALVAPDVTPKVFEPIDPSLVPAPPKPAGNPGPGIPTVASPSATGALDTLLGRQNPAPIAVESFMQTLHPFEAQAKAAEKLVPGTGMPVHQEGDGHTVFEVARNWMPESTPLME